MHYYKRNLGDYAKKAGRLSMLQHGAYTLLIDACYDREQFPTMQEAIDWAWASSAAEIEAVEFVLRKFFVLEDGCYTQSRIRDELNEYRTKAETNARIAHERETKRKELATNRARSVNGSTPNQEPITNNQEPIQDQEPAAVVTATPAKPKRKTKSALPATFLLTTDMAKWARERAPSVNLNTETEKFCNHWRSKGETRADWLATWYNWMLRAQEYAPRGAAAKPVGPDFHSGDTSWANDLGPL